MEASYRSKTFRYFQCQFTSNYAPDLQTCLNTALGKKPKAILRTESIDILDQSVRLINTHRQINGHLCGTLFSYTSGNNQIAALIDSNADELSVEQIAPPKRNGQASEFIEGLVFFVVKKNHIVFVGSQSIRSESLEAHFNWLMRHDITGVLQEGQHILMVDPDTSKRANYRSEAVKSIGFDSGIEVSADTKQVRNRKEAAFKPVGKVWAALVTLVKALDVKMPDIDFDPSLKPEDLKVHLELIHDRRRDSMEGPTPILDPIANAFRHTDKDNFVINYRDGTSLRGSDLKVKDTKRVPCVNGIPMVDKTFEKMMEWLEEVLKRPDIVL